MDLRITFSTPHDIPAMLGIERESFEFPWNAEEFHYSARSRNEFGYTARIDNRIVGYLVYEMRPKTIIVRNLAVHPDERRRGIATVLMQQLLPKLDWYKRRRIVLDVRERNVNAQKFLRAIGFLCVETKHDLYEACDEDAYVFEMLADVPLFQEAG